MTAIRNLALYLTESCNLACPYCFAANMEQRQIDEGLAREALERLLFCPSNEARKLSVTFWGGEPLLAFDLLQSMVLYGERRAKETGRSIRFGFPTNLTLLTGPILDFLLEHDVGFSLSLDGDEPAQRLRRLRGGQSSFPLVLEKLALLRDRLGTRLPGVRMTVSPETAGELVHNVRFFLERGFGNVYFSAVADVPWSESQLAAYEREQHRLADQWIASLRDGRPWSATSWNKSLARRELQRRGAPDGARAPCGAGSTMLAVDIYGDVFPCHRFAFYDKTARGNCLGNVRDLARIPQLEMNPAAVRIHEDGADVQQHLDAARHFCPALNCAMCGDLHRIHPRLVALQSIEQRVLDRIEAEVGEQAPFRDFVEKVVVTGWGELSASTVMLLSRVTSSDADTIAAKAEAVLARLQRQRNGDASS